MQPLQSLEGENHDRPNISGKEAPFSHQSSDQNVGGKRPGQTMQCVLVKLNSCAQLQK